MKLAVNEGQEYLDKCGTEKDEETYQTYVKRQLPKFAVAIKKEESIQRFNLAGNKDDHDEMISAGKELIALDHPASLDIALMIATIGYNELVAQQLMHRDDAVKYAAIALEKLTKNQKSDSYGLFKYAYKTEACSNGADNAAGWMNYILGFDLSNRGKKDEAIPYYYKATQLGCETKNMGQIYSSISTWYIDKAKVLEKQLNDKITAAGGNQTDETRSLEAVQDVYLDRALDAMGRAYKVVSAARLVIADSVYKSMRDLYDSRYRGNMTGFDQFVAKVGSDPLPDPTAEIKPPPQLKP